MNSLDLTLPTPAENLACDEALLDCCEESGCPHGILRFWEPADYFVVVGYANQVATEVNQAACEAHKIPILRRCSGGGTVLQGPGCLNYSLVLKIDDEQALENIPATNQFVMSRNRDAIAMLLSGAKAQTASASARTTSPAQTAAEIIAEKDQSMIPSIQGHTDLALNRLKFSGNAQRRKKRFLLFHGTFLLRFDLAQVGRFLPLPSRQPDYRQQRAHQDFLTNLHLPCAGVKRALAGIWRAAEPLEEVPHERIDRLVRHKYVTRNWNFRF